MNRQSRSAYGKRNGGFTKPLFIMAILACIGLIGIWYDHPVPQSDLEIWLFARAHRQVLCDGNPSLVQQYQKNTGKTISVDQMVLQAEDVRLLSMFLSPSQGLQMPDAVEIEINSVGKYFRPPLDQVGFYPLNDWIARLPANERPLPSRLAPWSKSRVVFGIPHDINPVAILYRIDLFVQAGVDLNTAKTWSEFQKLCLDYQAYWSRHGHPEYRAIELRRSRPDNLLMMLMQRHINPLDDQNRVHIADKNVAATVAFYAQLVVGPAAISSDTPAADVLWTKSLESGAIGAALCPDWRLAELKSYSPELANKVRLMPLPKFQPSDAPTATWGGTMTGIPRAAKNPEASWRMIQFLYLSPQAIKARQQFTDILPAIPAAWDDPGYHRPDPFFGGQKIDELYIELARQLPERYVTPYSLIAEQQISSVMTQAIEHMRDYGSDGLEPQCQQWLTAAATDLQRRVDFGKFDN
ncbi:MAG TPA: extracellular solute-binding protein [Tepidisphaeraceae bacterium]|jgi:ABC-type glycerol-3-phosphate transport system substrate-binding protein